MRGSEKEVQARVSAALRVDEWFSKRRGHAPTKRRRAEQRQHCNSSQRSKETSGTQPVVSNIEVSSDSAGFVVRCRLDGEEVTYRDGLSRTGCDAVLLYLRSKMTMGRH